MDGAVRNFGTAVNCWCVCVCVCPRGGVEFKITVLLMCAACTVNMPPVRTLEELAFDSRHKGRDASLLHEVKTAPRNLPSLPPCSAFRRCYVKLIRDLR